MRAAIVGAGLTGLTAAYRLKQKGWDVVVFEAEDYVGGRCLTGEEKGYRYEFGASIVAKSYDSYFALASELGVRLTPTPSTVATYRNGKVYPIRLDRPIRSSALTGLLSPRAKLSSLKLMRDVAAAQKAGYLDYSDLSKSAPIDNETAGDYLRRRGGDELFAYLGDPLIRTMTMADADKMSKVEFFSGMKNVFDSQGYTTEGGQQAMATELARHVPVKTGHAVKKVVETVEGAEVDGEHFDAVVVSCPLPVAYEMCPNNRDLLGPLNSNLAYTECLSVAIGTSRKPNCEAWIVQLSSRDFTNVAQMVLEHNKRPGLAPNGHGLFTCLWEMDSSVQHRDDPNEALGDETMAAITRVFPELRGTLDFVDVKRWKYAIPRTDVGRYKMIAEFNEAIDPASRVQFAGDYRSAAGQHTAITFGTKAAQNILAHT